MDRRRFLRSSAGLAVGAGVAGSIWSRALGAPVQPGPGPYGPLLPPDANGLELPEGFTSRVIAHALQPVGDTGHMWHPFPDGGACIAADDGWIYVSNSENPPPGDVPLPPVVGPLLNQVIGGLGGVGCIRFDAGGNVVDAYSILSGSRSNCAGGLTPWGTWLSCEEWEAPDTLGGDYTAGRVWECDPFGGEAAIDRPALGRCKHEMVAVDPGDERLYLTEDLPDGLLYRFTPTTWGDLSAGTLEAAKVAGNGSVTWLAVADPEATTGPLREQVAATAFDGGEGCLYDGGLVYFTTKNDNRVWVLDVAAQTITVLYDGAEFAEPVLDGVDHVAISPQGGHLYVAEDGGNLEICMITRDRQVAAVACIDNDDPRHGDDTVSGIPTESEVSGLAFDPSGSRLYFNSMRGDGFGILYEISGPFEGRLVEPAPTTTTTQPDEGTLPATGASGAGWWGLGALAAGAAVWQLRQRAGDDALPTPRRSSP